MKLFKIKELILEKSWHTGCGPWTVVPIWSMRMPEDVHMKLFFFVC